VPAVYVSITTCDAGTAGKVEPFSTSTVAVAQLLQCWQGMFPYLVTCPCQDPGSTHRQWAGGLGLYGNQP